MKSLFKKVKYIAFDADDTLWVNEPYFRKAEQEYCTLLERFACKEEIISTLYGVEMKNPWKSVLEQNVASSYS